MEKINGLATFESGNKNGKPIVFIHAFPLNHSLWDAEVKLLSKTHRVITYDIRGFGQSEVGDGQHSIEFFVDDLISILDHLKIQQTSVCGLSMGGYIALRAVERHPDRFKSLILCDTKSEADSNEAKIKRMQSIQGLKKDGTEKFADATAKNLLCELTLTKKPTVVEKVRNLIKSNHPKTIIGALLALAARTDTTAALSKMDLPTLILVGEQDKVTPLANAESMQKALSHAKHHVIPDAGHLSNLENPEVFQKHLMDFLN